MPTPDAELLNRFRTCGDEAAFTELVHRHLGLVHSAALRITGQAVLAQEVSQSVFTKLAQARAPLRDGLPLVAWLHRTTRSTAIDLLRAETRRRQREQTAASFAAMSEPSVPWERISPVLDEIIDRLPPDDRHLVLSRFFEGRSHAELARSLGLSEDAVRMRVNRALEKVRRLLHKRGIVTTAAALSMALPAQAITALPSGLAASVSACALAASAAPASLITLGILTMTKKSALAASAALLLAAAGTAVYVASDKASSSATAPAGRSAPVTAAPSGESAPAAKDAASPRFRARDRAAAPAVSADEAGLISRYGEARVKLAKRLTDKMLGFLGDDGLRGLMPLIGPQMKMGNLAAITAKLELTDEQKPQVEALLAKEQQRQTEQLDTLLNELGSNHLQIAEILLVGDAFKRGELPEQEYKDTITRIQDDPSGIRELLKVGKPGDAGSLMADPEFSAALIPLLDPSQAELLAEVEPTPAPAANFDMSLNQAERLEDLDRKLDSATSMFDGMKKIMEGMQAMEQLQTPPSP
jgi:RNA polymerase sigma factor (sigma-70 family)